MHARRTLLGQIKTALDANSAIKGCWLQRSPPTRNLWPCVTIYVESETVDTQGLMQPRMQIRTMQVIVKGWVRPREDDEAMEADMDQLCVEIEETLKGSSLTSEKDLTLESTSFQMTDIAPDAGSPVYLLSAEMGYRLTYATAEYAPRTLI